MPWWVWLLVGWLVVAVVFGVALGYGMRRAREIDRERGGGDC